MAGSYPFVLASMAVWVLSIFTLLIYLGQTVSPPFFALFVKGRDVSGAFFTGGLIALIPLLFMVYVTIRSKYLPE